MDERVDTILSSSEGGSARRSARALLVTSGRKVPGAEDDEAAYAPQELADVMMPGSLKWQSEAAAGTDPADKLRKADSALIEQLALKIDEDSNPDVRNSALVVLK